MIRMIARAIPGALVALLAISPAAGAATRDYADTALNIIPSGQWGGFPLNPKADLQAKMYDGLTPLFGNVKPNDLTKYFKSERFGGKGTVEKVPRKGVRIVRDSYNVPHITGKKRDDVIWGAGWVAAEDRQLLIDQARFDARIAAIDAPGLDAFTLVQQLRQFVPSAQTEAVVARQTNVLKKAGAKGRSLLHDIDVYAAGMNAQYKAAGHPADPPFGRTDVYAVNALAGQLFGRGGGDEVRRSMFLDGLQKRLGSGRGLSVFNDLRNYEDPASPVTIDKAFAGESKMPSGVGAGNAVIDDGSFQRTPAAKLSKSAAPPDQRRSASNFLVVGAKRSSTGHPLFVAGPQIGYFYPGLTMEMDLHGGGIDARGATAPGLNPGAILIGRGADFAWSLTSAGSDVIDQYAETLCGASDHKYMYEGKCRNMHFFNAGVIKGSGGAPDQPVTFWTTVHGPVIGYATSKGVRVAISSKRSSYGKDVLWELPFVDASNGRIDSPQTFIKSFAQSPFTFNSVYADDKHISMISTGLFPKRPKSVNPGLITKGNGKFEWQGFLPHKDYPRETDPKDGILVNWNNRPAKDWPAADDEWGYGSLYRMQMLRNGLVSRRKHTLATVVSAMNRAATQDFRDLAVVPDIAAVLKGSTAPSPRDQKMLDLMLAWRRAGSSRLDRNNDGKVDDPGAAIVDAAWPGLADAVMQPVIGPQLDALASLSPRNPAARGDFQGGWLSYMDKDLRTLAGQKVAGTYRNRFCGGGNKAACQQALWGAIHAAGDTLQAAQGPDPSAWRADANAEKISFAPGLLPFKMRYTNRPTGIQQVISFGGHRP
ncbi:MAG TPA: penicillin acylase family protein [Thermoleophilaceae bacterium]